MLGRGFPTQRKGAIRTSTINAGLRAASGLLKLRVGPGLGLKWLGDTPLIELVGGLLGAEIGKAPAPIAGRVGNQLGTGMVELYDLAPDGLLSASGRLVPAANLAGTAVAADAWLILLRIATFRVVIWEECPA